MDRGCHKQEMCEVLCHTGRVPVKILHREGNPRYTTTNAWRDENDAPGNLILHSKEQTAESLLKSGSVCLRAEQSGSWERWNQH